MDSMCAKAVDAGAKTTRIGFVLSAKQRRVELGDAWQEAVIRALIAAAKT